MQVRIAVTKKGAEKLKRKAGTVFKGRHADAKIWRALGWVTDPPACTPPTVAAVQPVAPTYGRRDMQAAPANRAAQPTPAPSPADELAAARAQYKETFGKRPYSGWDAATLREKIKAAVA